MAIKVRFLSEDVIEHDAEMLIAAHEETAGAPIAWPVPVTDITTYHLALRLGFADLHHTLGIPMQGNQPDILGAIWVNKEAILIDRSLDPKEYPSMLGRYRFSVAHEVGHWRLHRSYVAQDASQTSFLDAASTPTVICRSSEGIEPIEWQANYYASCLLMPRNLLIAAWNERFGNTRPRSFERRKRFSLSMEGASDEMIATFKSFEQKRDDQALNEYFRPFADKFQVSMVAMRIRLERIGLLRRCVPSKSFGAAGRPFF